MDHRPRHSLFGTLVKIGIALFFWREITVLLVVGLLLVGPFLAGAIMGSVIGGVVSGDAMNPPGAFMLVGGLLTTVAVWAWVLFSGAIIGDRTDREQVAAFKDALERTLATLTHTLSPQWEARRFPPQGQVNGPSGQFLACRAPKGDTGITVYVRVARILDGRPAATISATESTASLATCSSRRSRTPSRRLPHGGPARAGGDETVHSSIKTN